ENQLFDAIDAVLADVQRPALARFRVQRDIARTQSCYASHLRNRHPCAMVSLRAFIDAETIPPAARAEASELLDVYDLELARLTRLLCDHLAGYVADVYDTVSAAGFSRRSIDDRAERPLAYRCYGEALQKNDRTSREWVFRIATLHRRTLHDLEAIVYPHDLTAVRNAFTTAAYVGLFREPHAGREALDTALGGDVDIPMDVRRALNAMRETYIARRRSLEDTAMAMYDEVALEPAQKQELRPARREVRLEREALELETAELVTEILQQLNLEQDGDRGTDIASLDASPDPDR
ncbi:MAG: hypothetical protein KC983_03860, partial [Phycisphaerales bacterium]|nr:hypothetical protein [Phycisphaerales bacterium]